MAFLQVTVMKTTRRLAPTVAVFATIAISSFSTTNAQTTPPRRDETPTGRLLRQPDLKYLRSFRLPEGDHGASKFHYGGTAIAYNPKRDSLFIVGHDWDQAVAEVQIPAIQTGPLPELQTATLLQPFVKVA